jgi:hypothetical protein
MQEWHKNETSNWVRVLGLIVCYAGVVLASTVFRFCAIPVLVAIVIVLIAVA